MPLLIFFVVGVLFGATLIQSEVSSWFRIQEMFRFQAFHMYGVIASALAVAAVSLAAIRRLGLKTADGEPAVVPPKVLGGGYRYWIGGTLFGLGWALTGACPGPFFALWGAGVGTMGVSIIAALAGTWVYAWVRPRLPH